MEQPRTLTFLVSQTPQEVFAAICNVRAWWTIDTDGRSERVGDEFEVRFGDVHRSRQKLIEAVPGRRIVWLVTDSRLNFIADKQEWTGTKICFDISRRGLKTQVRFTHLGLTPSLECFETCMDAWNLYIKGSLRKLITTGEGRPEPVLQESAEASAD